MKTRIISESDFSKTIFPEALKSVHHFKANSAVSAIKPSTLLREDLNMDSLDITESIIILEKKYDIKMPFESYKNHTVNDIYQCFNNAALRKQRAINMYHCAHARAELSNSK